MYRKSFTSFSISQYKLKLVRLSGDKKKITKFATYVIPEGMISQGRVQKPDELAKIIADVWRKEHIRDRTVGIIVPEFSTFMKALTLPKLPMEGLDEAVRWQAREFLPIKSEEMVLDWKIIDEKPDTYEVLTVATEKNVLFGFVDAVNKAGLLPLLVETPSLSLERLAETKDKGKLVIYRSKGVVVATVISGKKILASSVILNSTDDVILKDLYQIEARFGKIVINSISVCGNGLTQQFINTLQEKFQLPIEGLKMAISGLTPEQIQEYIIPLSQQMIDPDEPESPSSINLLPPVWVIHYRRELRDLRAWTLTLVASVVTWSCLLVILASYIFLSQQTAQEQTGKPQGSSTDVASLTKEITTVNGMVTRINKYFGAFSYPQVPLNLIASKKTADINITRYNINVESGKIDLIGVATTRTALIDFKGALESVPNFSSVTLPLTSLLVETNVPFEISMDYKK